MARLFVAVRPPEGAVTGASVRDPHVTLCFLGDVPDDRVPEVVDAFVRGLDGVGAVEATLEAGRPRRLGPSAVVRSVLGLDGLAGAVRSAVGGFAARPDERRFRGHLTVARRRRGDAASDDGQGPAGPEVRWLVTEVALVRSDLGRGPGGTARHEDVAVVRLVPPAGA